MAREGFALKMLYAAAMTAILGTSAATLFAGSGEDYNRTDALADAQSQVDHCWEAEARGGYLPEVGRATKERCSSMEAQMKQSRETLTSATH